MKGLSTGVSEKDELSDERGCVFMSGLGESVTFSFTHKQTTPSKMVEGQQVKEGRRRGIHYDGGEMHRHL